MQVQVHQQKRRSLAMKVLPSGVQVLIPQDLDPNSAQVQQFIEEGLSKLAAPEPLNENERLTKQPILDLVDQWAQRLHVTVTRVQLRAMRNKWGSISTAGTLTLADDLLRLPPRLVEYVVVHELLQLIVPTHTKAYRLQLSQHIPDWQQREQELGGWVIATSQHQT
jgi:hypothetical protein